MSANEPALLTLVKETVDGLGALVSGHVRLARAELGRDVQAYGRRAALVAVATLFALLGYALACVAGALALTRVLSPPLAFVAVGGAHLVGAIIALAVLLKRAAHPPLDESLTELGRTVAALTPGDHEPSNGKETSHVIA